MNTQTDNQTNQVKKGNAPIGCLLTSKRYWNWSDYWNPNYINLYTDASLWRSAIWQSLSKIIKERTQ